MLEVYLEVVDMGLVKNSRYQETSIIFPHMGNILALRAYKRTFTIPYPRATKKMSLIPWVVICVNP